jgi:hypothetical protein
MITNVISSSLSGIYPLDYKLGFVNPPVLRIVCAKFNASEVKGGVRPMGKPQD